MYDFDAYPYPSRRYLKYSGRGMCATSNHLAAQAGLDILKKGGNAIDAAVAAATCLTVLEANANGVGSDAFAIICTGGKLYGLNASGYSPKSLTAKAVRDAGHAVMPRFGFTPVTVPGAPGAWAALAKRFGRLPLTQSMAPAVSYAAEGQTVGATLSQEIAGFASALKQQGFTQNEYAHWFETFLPAGEAPKPGMWFKNPDFARTLEQIAQSGADAFYHGPLAEKMDAYSKKYNGYLRFCDLDEYSPEWVEPVSVNYRGYDVWELPPNGQGLVALMALNILRGFEPAGRDDVLSVHRQLEAMKLAFADGQKYITDPAYMTVSVKDLLSDAFAEERRKLIVDSAALPTPAIPPRSGTVYLCTADGEGNMVSYIQSNYMGFGSGLVVPGTGIALQNRGNCFSLEEGHDNIAAPRKRPYHTIIPAFLTKGGEAVGPFGLMGGFMQPQGHTQVMLNYIDCGMNPQSCLDAPRWQWVEGKRVIFEPSYPTFILEGLRARGHEAAYQDDARYGKGQMIFRTQYGGLMGATEPRCEGECAGW